MGQGLNLMQGLPNAGGAEILDEDLLNEWDDDDEEGEGDFVVV